MAAVIPPEEDRFQSNMLALVDLVRELIATCHASGKTTINPALISLARGILESYDKKVAIENFIGYSYEFWDQISKREEIFFLENCSTIFRDIPGNHLDAFRELYEARDAEGKPIIIESDKDAMWEFFDSLIKICIKFIHRERGPTMKDLNKGKGPQPVYTVNSFPDVRLQHYSNVWKVDLLW